MRRWPGLLPHNILWLDALYPIALVFLLCTALTKLVYTGAAETTLAAKADFAIMAQQLRLISPFRGLADSRLAVVSLDPPELGAGGLSDQSLQQYATVLEQVLRQAPALVVLRLLPGLHENDARVYAPLVAVLEKYQRPHDIIIAYPQTGEYQVPASLRQLATVVDDDPCAVGILVCPYVSSWDDWVVQVVLKRMSAQLGYEPPAAAVTEFFPIRFPTFVVDVAAPQSFIQLSAKRLEQLPTSAKILAGSSVFIGLEQTQAALSHGVKTANTVYDSGSDESGWGHTPLHQFWAQIADMHLSGRFVRVAPAWLVYTGALLSALWVGWLFVHFGVGLGSVLTIIWLLVLSICNFLALALFRVYLPSFCLLYASALSFVFMGFGRLSSEAFGRWLAAARLEQVVRLNDLKSNFIALLSHNLNTPIAKMAGMTSLLGAQMGHSVSALNAAEAHLARLEATIRTNLLRSVLDEGGLRPEPIVIARLYEEFLDVWGSGLRRAGIVFTSRTEAADPELAQRPLFVDKKLVTHVAAALLWVAKLKGMPEPLQLLWRLVSQDDGRVALELSLAGLQMPTNLGAGSDFLLEVLGELLGALPKLAESTLHQEPTALRWQLVCE